MAVWQFDFHLISRKKMLTLFGEMPSSLDDEVFSSVQSWEESLLPEDYDALLDAFMLKKTSWSATTTMWGEEDGDRIEISNDSGYVKYIFARIDARKRNDHFLEGIVRFASHVDAVLFTAAKGQLIEPSVKALVGQVQESNAFKFVQDPQGFFESISKGEIEITGFKKRAT